MIKNFLTLKEATNYASLSVSFWRRAIASGRIHAYKPTNRVLLKTSEIDSFIEQGKMDVPNVRDSSYRGG